MLALVTHDQAQHIARIFDKADCVEKFSSLLAARLYVEKVLAGDPSR